MISQTAEYALRAVVVLGGASGRPLTTRQIAARAKIPASYLSKVLQSLGRAELLDAQRGLGGGYVLARSLREPTILDVINAVDPLIRIDRCPLNLPEHRREICPLHRRLDEGIALLESLYGGTTIAELVESHPLCAVGDGVCEQTPLGRVRS
jgi:Rrf2 family nitric oxide-sensitive transcriptional repressor